MSKSTLSEVKGFWESRPCGVDYAVGYNIEQQLQSQADVRYALEPYISPFAKFYEGQGKRVLEIGVGLGADHLEWAKSQPSQLAGIDLTEQAVRLTRSRCPQSDVRVADAEELPFENESFDIVYSWGVLHHSPNTEKAIQEVHRVLKPGGVARLMLYQRYSLTIFMLWAVYGLRKGLNLKETAAQYLESPGTKAYSRSEIQKMLAAFSSVDVRVELGTGDLLLGLAGHRHQGRVLALARAWWPRWFIRRFMKGFGLVAMIEAKKS
jgi:ubiquinone/menaquinone biosynthesis C-methylase UbiE